jgi:hypothetical protein
MSKNVPVPPLKWRFAQARILRLGSLAEAALVSATKERETWSLFTLHGRSSPQLGTVDLVRLRNGYWEPDFTPAYGMKSGKMGIVWTREKIACIHALATVRDNIM